MSPTKKLIVTFIWIAWLTSSCGPSLRRTYQSDNAFGRCFDMDYNPGISKPEKEQCWSTWLNKHLYNQQDDKIRYARLRMEELSKGILIPGPPGPPGAFDQRPKPSSYSGKKDKKKEPQSDIIPGSTCAKTCEESLMACRQACEPDAGSTKACSGPCDAGYKGCMKHCFEDK